MVRLPRGWTRLKELGNVEPVQILVHRDSGKFGTRLYGEEADIREHDSLADAEAWVKQINEEGAVDAIYVSEIGGYNDRVVRLDRVRVKRLGRGWARMDGTRISNSLMVPDGDALQQIEALRTQHAELLKQAEAIRNDAWEIVRHMRSLDL